MQILIYLFVWPPHCGGRALCHFFVVPQRNGERKGTRGKPLRTPRGSAAQRFAPSVASLSLRQGGAQRCYLTKFRVSALKKREHTTAAVRPKCLRFSLNRKREIFTKQHFQAAPWRNASKASHSATRSGLPCSAKRSGFPKGNALWRLSSVASCDETRSDIHAAQRGAQLYARKEE